MRLLEITEPEDRLRLHDTLAAFAGDIDADRCFYVSGKRDYPEARTLLYDALDRIGRHAPLSVRDVIVWDRSSEAGQKFDMAMVRALLDFSTAHGLPLGAFVVSAQTPMSPNLVEGLRAAGSTERPGWLAYHHFVDALCRTYETIPLDDFDYRTLESLPPRFLCTNYKLRPHRAVLLDWIRRSPIAGSFLVSDFRDGVLFHRAALEEAIGKRFPSFADAFDPVAAFDAPPTALGSPFADLDFVVSFPESAARRSILTVVTESDFMLPMQRVTEKSFKPAIYHRPFIVWGPPGCLGTLRDFGVRTFDGLVDEGYDEVADPDERLLWIVEEIRRLHAHLSEPARRRAFLREAEEICAFNQRFVGRDLLGSLQRRTITRLNLLLARVRTGMAPQHATRSAS